MWNLGCLTCVRHSSNKSSVTHSYQGVQYPRVSKQWYGCQCLGFLTCTQMLRHAIAHVGCTDTVRGSALEVETLTLGEKSLAAPGTRTSISIMPGFSVGWSTSWAVPAPHLTLLAFNYVEKCSAACTGEVFYKTLKAVGVMWFLYLQCIISMRFLAKRIFDLVNENTYTPTPTCTHTHACTHTQTHTHLLKHQQIHT